MRTPEYIISETGSRPVCLVWRVMVIGSGIDVMAVNDMQRELTHGAWIAADGIFRQSELDDCNAARSPARKFAAYFAAKEAAAKALDVRVTDLAILREIEVISSYRDQVKICFHGRAHEQCDKLGVKRVVAALHANRHLAAAMVILEA